MIKILFIGDIVAGSGLEALKNLLPEVKKEFSPDLVIANGENAAKGFGLTPANMKAIIGSGVDIITGGNHIFDRREVAEVIDSARLVRPENYAPSTPGKGWRITEAKGVKVGVLNLVGRVFMSPVDSPFVAAERAVAEMKAEGAEEIIVDFHAEATSEKAAMGFFLDGRVSAVIGTHTHVQTADEKILAGKTGFISDAGMTGDADSVIGIEKKAALRRFLTSLPVTSPSAEGKGTLNAVFLEVEKGGCLSIKRVQRSEKR